MQKYPDKNGEPLDEDMANELEILRLMRQQTDDVQMPALPLSPPAPAHSKKRTWKETFWSVLEGIVPKKGDAPLEVVRKCVFIVALLVLIGSVSYIINDMVIIPVYNGDMYTNLAEKFDPDHPAPRDPKYADYQYPDGMDPAFENLYPLNNELRGWLRYSASGTSDFLKINYPILYSGDNKFYLEHDFYKKPNKNGALFFDERNTIESKNSRNKVTILYGHNMASGQMFSPLNKLNFNPKKPGQGLGFARAATVMSMDTLYERNQYKVFATILVNDNKEDGPRFNYLRTSFSNDADFTRFVAELRARSLYDYGGVDVNASDELLILSTCTVKSQVFFDNGRLAVIARRVRPGESATVDSRQIANNEDAIMPLAWYENQKLSPHPFYTDSGYILPEAPGTPPTGGTQTVPVFVPPTGGTTLPGGISVPTTIPGTKPPVTKPGETTSTTPPTTSAGPTAPTTAPVPPPTSVPTASAPTEGTTAILTEPTTLPTEPTPTPAPPSDPTKAEGE